MKVFFLQFLFSLFLCSLSMGYEYKKEITALGDKDYPPHEFIDSSGKPSGFTTDLLKAVAGEMGFKVKIALCDWKDARDALENGKCDIVSMCYSADRAKYLDFSVPHSHLLGAIFVKTPSNIKSIKDIRNKRVLVQEKNILHDYMLKNNFSKITAVTSDEKAIIMLSKGDYDCALVFRSNALYMIKKLRINNVKELEKQYYKEPFIPVDYCFAVKHENAPLLSTLNEGLRIIKVKGIYKKIYDKWFGILEPEPFPFRKFIKYSLLVISPFLLVILFSFAWVKTLNKKVAQKTAELQEEIAERKKIENALRASEEKHRVLIENMNEAVYHMSIPDGNFIYLSKKMETVFGYNLELLENNLFKKNIVHPEFLDYFYVEWNKLINGIVSPSYTYKIIDSEGKERWIHQNNAGIYGEDGKTTGIIGCCENITDQVKAQEERESLINKLEEQNEELERFTYTVSHDLKSPLTTIQGFVNLLKNESEINNLKNLSHYLERISNSTNKMYNMLCELLEFSRLGRVNNTKTTFNFRELIFEVIDSLSIVIANKKPNFIIDQEFPDICADRIRITEVMVNLIENAIKFTSNNLQPEIEIGNRKNDHETIFFVRDNGIGIDQKYKTKIFELFSKLDPSTSGNGVGLSIVKRIVELNGGRIWIESELNWGTTFFFTLPTSEIKENKINH